MITDNLHLDVSNPPTELPIVAAAAANDLEDVVALLEQGVDPNCYEDDAQVTPLHFAVQHNNLAMVKVLLEHGADPLAIEVVFGLTPIELAVEMGLLEVLSLLSEYIKHKLGPRGG